MCVFSGSPSQGFSREVSAAHRAFHGCRPASRGPITGQKDSLPTRRGRWPVGINSRTRRVSRVHLFYDGRLGQIRLSRGGKELSYLGQCKFNDLVT